MAFLGRPNTRTFGEATFGVPTANSVYKLSDGTLLILTEAVDADRTGRTYDHKILPDQFSQTNWASFGTDNDPVIQDATTWLQTQTGCNGSLK